jgi:hypothetical protein
MPNDERDQTLPLAEPEHEEVAGRVFEGWDTMCPEEWAARFSHTVGCSSFDLYQYRNPKLHAWIHRLHQILSKPELIKEYRNQFLTLEDIQAIDDFEF